MLAWSIEKSKRIETKPERDRPNKKRDVIITVGVLIYII